jgi:nucleoside phosphorylase
MPPSPEPPAHGGPVDVAVLTVIRPELLAARDALGFSEGGRVKDGDGTVYFRGAVRSELRGRDYSVVLTCVGAAGNPGAAAAVRDVIAAYQPRAVLLMGIAAGVRGKVRIGEVVLSERVVAYETAALVRGADGGLSVEARPEIDRAPHAMQQDLASYRADPERIAAAFARIGGEIPPAPSGRKREYREHVATAITVRDATVASGEKLLRDPSRLLELRRIHGKVEVGEMEAAGLVEACRRGGVPWLILRGISDFGDELKDDRFHDFAARAAAAVLADFLAHGLDLGGRATAATPRGGSPDRPARRSPFVFGRPIDRDQDLFGREHEKDRIRDAIDKGQPVQLLGERLMGKSSLLRWVERHARHAPPARPVAWIDPRSGLSPVTMVRAIAEKLGRGEIAAALDRPGATVEEASRALARLAPFALLIDDANALALHGRGFDVGFFETVRPLVESRELTWVSASQRNLYDLFSSKGLTSRFLNGAVKVWVGLLDDAAARGLAERGAEEHAGELLRAAGRFAHGIQWLGDRLLESPGGVEEACDAFHREMEPVFRAWWAGLAAQERQLLKGCVDAAADVERLDRATRSRLRSLRDRGLLAEQGGRLFLEGEGWQGFVRDAP